MHFKKGDLGDLPEPERWVKYKKMRPTSAIRIRQPFTCETVEGNVVECRDGYLCLDDKGHPYPCDPEVFESTYAPLTDEEIAAL